MTDALMKIHEFDDSVYFRIPCSCRESNHDLSLCFRDADFPVIEIEAPMYVKGQFDAYHEDGWKFRWLDLKWRLSTAISILFRGKVDATMEFILDKENVQAFSSAIEYTKEKFKQ